MFAVWATGNLLFTYLWDNEKEPLTIGEYGNVLCFYDSQYVLKDLPFSARPLAELAFLNKRVGLGKRKV